MLLLIQAKNCSSFVRDDQVFDADANKGIYSTGETDSFVVTDPLIDTFQPFISQ